MSRSRTMLSRKAAIFIAATAALASTGFGADFYVSSVRSGRNDANAGTSPSAPWATFDKVKQAWGTTIRAGDTVHLERGSVWTWSGDTYWRIQSGGTSAGALTVRGDDYGTGAKPLLKKTSGSWDTTISIGAAASHITLRDFAIDGGSQSGTAGSGVSIGEGSHSGTISHIKILNMTFQNLGNSANVYVCGLFVAPRNNQIITDCLFEGNDISGYTAHGIAHYTEKGPAKSNSRVFNTVYRNNRIHNRSVPCWVNAGFAFIYGGSGNIIEYNTIEGNNDLAALVINPGANDETGLIVRHNVFKNNGASNGIVIPGFTDGAPGTRLTASIYGNIVSGCRYAGMAIETENYMSVDVSVHNNTFYNNATDASYASWGGGVFVPGNNNNVALVLKNNIVVNRNGALCLKVSDGFSGSVTHENNLYWRTAGASATVIYHKGQEYTGAQVNSYEATGVGGDPHFSDALGGIPISVTQSGGTDRDGLAPLAGSPALAKGKDLGTSFRTSIDGPTRAGAWDLGAYQVSEVTVPAAPTNLRITFP